MKKLLALFLGEAGMFVSNTANMACPIWVLDEPKMPNSMIER